VSKNRVIVTSVVLEGRSKVAVARDYGVSRRWVHVLVGRYLAGGWEAVEPGSRRPKTSPRTTPAEKVVAQILALRRELTGQGHDGGAATIAFHLERLHGHTPAVSTIWKILKRHGLIDAQPKKRPRSSYLRFEADLPNECWQSDFTHWRLADESGVDILTFLDDHSRYALSITCHRVVTGAIVVDAFRRNVDHYGPPAATLTDNGLVFTARFRGGRNAFEDELRLLGIIQRNGKPNHPQTQGKVERFQQTLKKWLRSQPAVENLEQLQTQLDIFGDYYNKVRPHRSLNRRTPAQTYDARTKAGPEATVGGHWRIRDDRVDKAGIVTLRHHSRLHHIGVGRVHKGTRVRLLIHNLHIRIIAIETGELLHDLTLDPSKDYQPQKPQNPTPKGEEM